jgi:hypothetical protein
MFGASGLIFGGTEADESHFHVLRFRTCFRRYRECQISFSCFALPESFSTVPKEPGPVFLFCDPGLVLGGTEGVGSRFHVLHSRTRFRRYRGRLILFSCFALPDSFSSVPSASALIFMFSASGLVFDGIEGGRSNFYV